MVSHASNKPELCPLIQGTGRDGARFVFALSSQRRQCFIMRNGDTIFTAPSDENGIDAAVDLLFRECGTAQEPKRE